MNKQISNLIKEIDNASPIQIPGARIMTAQELAPRLNDIVEEIIQIKELIDFDDPAAESLETLMDVATDTKTQMETGIAA